MNHIQFLADDKLKGRESGGPGNPEATAYVAKQFKSFGLKPLGKGDSYLQPFKIAMNPELGRKCRMVVRVKADRQILKVGEDFLPMDNINEGDAFGKVVFAGYGITAPEVDYDDYLGINVTNRIALILRRSPDSSRDDSKFKNGSRGTPNRHALFNTKLANAKAHGARAVLILDAGAEHKSVKEMFDGGPYRIREQKGSIPFMWVRYGMVQDWMATAGKDLKDVVKGIDIGQRTDSFELPTILATLRVKIERQKVTVNNVIGLLEGSDPKLKNEYLVIGGHHDHVGFGRDRRNKGDGDFIHNGADDNASGTSAVLEMAQAFTSAKERPKRSILFMTFNAEERGLLGSRYYVDKPLIPLTNTIAMINLDMVGRGASGLDVGGVGTSPGFPEMIKRAGMKTDLKVTLTYGGKAPSDNTSFYNKNMPVLFFYTGKHDDYHKPTDDWEKIDKKEIQEVTRMAYGIANRLSNAPERPKFTKADGNPVRRGRPRLLLGIQIDPEHGGDGVRVLNVTAEQPAGKGGIAKGDVLLSLDGKPMRNVADIGRFLSTKKKGNKVKAVIDRGGKKVEKELTL
ncbi:MAG: M28 family peptidase [Limisphaerales bacterium]